MKKNLITIFTILMVLSVLLSACASPTPTAAPTQAEEESPTQEPIVDDKCVVIANYESSGEQMSMDPAIMYSGGDAPYLYAVYDRLVDVTPNFEVVPELAETWESSDDAKEWTFYLRKGVKFHDGTELTAEDVVYTYQRILDPAIGSSGMAILSVIESINAKDEYTVVFKTTEPSVTLPLLFTTKETGIVKNGADADDLRLNGMGTGPFIQEFFQPGNDYVKLVANPNYWQAGLPNAPCLEIRVIQEATTASAALQGGEVDVVLQLDSIVIPALTNNPNIKLLTTAAGNSMTLSMFTDTPPFDNILVRQALKKVVNREEMVQTVLLGFGEPGADNPIPLSDPLSYLFGKSAPSQDIEGAIALLEDAGYNSGNPLKIDLYASEAVPGHTRMAQVFVEQAAQAGIIVNIIQTPPESYWDEVWLKQSFVASAWSRRPVVVAEGMAYTCASTYPETRWCRPEFDELLAQAESELDEAKRILLLHQMQRMISDDGGVIIPMFIHAVAGVRANCSGWEPHVQNFNNDWSLVSCSP